MSFIEIEYRQRNKGWNMADLHTHDFYEIYFLLKGERNVFIEDKIFTLSENSIVIFPPFYMHKTEGGPYKRLNLYISADLLDDNEKEFLDSTSSLLSFSFDKAATSSLLSLLRPFINKTEEEELLLKKYSLPFAKSFLYLLQSSKIIPKDKSATVEKSDSGEKVILDVVAYINSHFREEITLNLLKNKFFISKNTLCKRFQEVMKCSVIEYASAVRLNEAKYLLSTTDKSMEEIAELCGYSSANYFSLIFKSKTGLSPSNYRKKN